MWTHVTTLAGKNVGRIYAGGDHSWALVGNIFINFRLTSTLDIKL